MIKYLYKMNCSSLLFNCSFVDDNQNSCGKFTNIFAIRAVDHKLNI